MAETVWTSVPWIPRRWCPDSVIGNIRFAERPVPFTVSDAIEPVYRKTRTVANRKPTTAFKHWRRGNEFASMLLWGTDSNVDQSR
jgi:hypothetical protein